MKVKCDCGWRGDEYDLKMDITEELPRAFNEYVQALVCPECGGFNSVSED